MTENIASSSDGLPAQEQSGVPAVNTKTVAYIDHREDDVKDLKCQIYKTMEDTPIKSSNKDNYTWRDACVTMELRWPGLLRGEQVGKYCAFLKAKLNQRQRQKCDDNQPIELDDHC